MHHVELWVEDLAEAQASWGWLLVELGWNLNQSWESGCSWSKGDMYIVATRPPTGGPDHYAAYLENSAGFKAELVAESRGSYRL